MDLWSCRDDRLGQGKTAEQQAQERRQAKYDAAAVARANAYRLESDPITTEAEFDATIAQPYIPTASVTMSCRSCNPTIPH